MAGLVIITPPTDEPITLAQAKEQLRVTGSDEDALITGYISDAREDVEDGSRRAIMPQTLELSLDAWPAENYIELPRPPLISVVSVKYHLADNSEQTFDAANYAIDTASEPGRLALISGASWPGDELYPLAAIRIQYQAGYSDPTRIPRKLIRAIMLLIGHYYEHREAAESGSLNEIPLGVQRAIGSVKVWTL